MSEEGSQTKATSRRPKNTQFHQQRLYAWQPILTAGTVSPFFFIIGIAFIPIGAVLLVASNAINEQIIDYTSCVSVKDNKTFCSDMISTPNPDQIPCQCAMTFNIDTQMKGEVIAYYALTNFYQNYRQYVKSRDDNQLNGQAVSSLNPDCAPYRTSPDTKKNYAPCGMIANSLFNDSFQLIWVVEDRQIEVNTTSKGIAWSSDKNIKFGKPATFNDTERPVNWKMTALERTPGAYNDDEPLLVWMRVAALPNFRKPYARVVHQSNTAFQNGLPEGQYLLKINYAYPVTGFNGTKRFILSTKSWLGGKNTALGLLYIVVGILMLLLAVGFVILHIFATRRKPALERSVSEDKSEVLLHSFQARIQ
jgi:hypothetical protein